MGLKPDPRTPLIGLLPTGRQRPNLPPSDRHRERPLESASMLPHGAARAPGRARRRALRGAAFQALLLVVLAGAWPAAVAAPGATPPASSATSVAQQAQPTVRALCPPAAPGYMSCLPLVRTARGPLARSAVGPLTMPRGFAPSQLLSAYGLPDAASGAGSGITVAVVDAFD